MTSKISWVRTWGSTEAERARPYACDRFLDDADEVLFRAVTVDAPAWLVYRWLCQLRVAPYSYDLLDNYGRRSPRVRDPENERLQPGATMVRIFKLVDLEPGRQLTMMIVGTKVFGEVVITYEVTPQSDGATRLVAKLRVRYPRRSLMRWILPLGDLMMMRKQLLTFKELAEREHRSEAQPSSTRSEPRTTP
jgi:hypothetical protein